MVKTKINESIRQNVLGQVIDKLLRQEQSNPEILKSCRFSEIKQLFILI